jgi:biotin carboxylase
MSVAFVVSDEGLGGIVPFGMCLAAAGVTPVLLTRSTSARQRKAWGETYEAIVELSNPYDANEICRAAGLAAQGREIAAIFSCYDGLCLPAAMASAAFGLPHPSIEGLRNSRNKSLARALTAAAGLPTPRFAVIPDEQSCGEAARWVQFPAILKPLNGLASHLVRRVDSLAELRSAYRYATERLPLNFAGNYRHLPGASPSDSVATQRKLLLEERLEGAEYSAEVIVRDGQMDRIALFHKFLISMPGFLESGFTSPPLTPATRIEPIWQHIEECLRAVGVDNAAAHVEVIDTPSGPRLVEINAGRAGGQILVLAARLATGVNLIDEIVALALGRRRPTRAEPESRERVTTFTVFPPRSGRLDGLNGLAELGALPRVARVVPFSCVGDVLDVDDKEVFAVNFLAWGGEEADLRALHEEACRRVEFQISDLEVAPPLEGAA